MRFGWSRATAEDGSHELPDSAPPAPSELAAVELMLSDGRLCTAWIDAGGQRASDWLNAYTQVEVRDVTEIGASADQIGMLVSSQPAPTTAALDVLERERIVWVVPPPLPPNRHLRLHRRRVVVHLELDDHEISGQVHVRPGADAVDQVMRGTRDLVPLTDVQLVSRADPSRGSSLPVLVVNRQHVRRAIEATLRATTRVPDPALPLPGGDGELDPRITWLVAEQTAVEPDSPATVTPKTEEPADEPSGVELLNSALTLLLEVGAIDVVEFQSIRARIPAPATD